MDPFLDLIRLLRPRATLWAGIRAGGRWGVSFRQREDTLFCWVEQGECLLVRPNTAPLRLQRDDFALVRTSTPFTLTSDPTLTPEESEALVAAAGHTAMRLGDLSESPVILHGGRFVFDTANEDLLMNLLPQILHIAATDDTSGPLRTLLALNREESRTPGPGSGFVIARLMELILVEVLRTPASHLQRTQTGLLAGLADPVVARALVAMHGAIAHPWTVASLARHCGLSRSGFSQRFSTVMGQGPMEYLAQWRIAVAKGQLRQGHHTVAEIALAIGFQSASAFSTAFTRATGTSPSRFAALATGPARAS